MGEYIPWLRAKVGHEPVVLVGASAVIGSQAGEILLVRRGDNGAWACPGGILEPGENIRSTLAREIKEELGVEADIGELLGVYTNRGAFEFPNGDIAYTVGVFFLCAIHENVKVDGTEALEYGFFSQQEALKLVWDKQREPLGDFFSGVRGVVK